MKGRDIRNERTVMSTAGMGMTIRGRENGAKGRGHADASSLGSLSRRFLEFVETRVDGVVDLNETARRLNAHKRRVYDVTNVLEGVELLEKLTKNYVRWTPHRLEAPSKASLDAEQLRKEITELEGLLRATDAEIEAIYANLRELNGLQERKKLFLRKKDIVSLAEMKGKRCFVLKVPKDTKIHRTSNTLTAVSNEGEIYSAPMEIDEACKENHS